jgi:hypothetical protein
LGGVVELGEQAQQTPGEVACAVVAALMVMWIVDVWSKRWMRSARR